MNIKKILQNEIAYIDYLKFIHPKHANHDYFNSFLKSKKDVENWLNTPLSEASVLIIGCGYRYPDVLLYSLFAKEVYGLDIVNAFYKNGFIALYHSLRKRDKSVLYSFLAAFGQRNGLRKNYYRQLSNISNLSLKYSDVNLIQYDGKKAPFKDNQFDVVLSNAVLEHVDNLEMFYREVARITKPNGLSYHLYHNYYSFSGGHLAEKLNVKHPWGHLRGIYNTNSKDLNKKTLEEILGHFSSFFKAKKSFPVSKDHSKKGIDKTFSYEKEELLTKDIRKELIEFSDEQLLTRAYLIIGTKI